MIESDVAVVGGGIGGLTAAHELAERGFDVTVLEANDRFGGKARSMPIADTSGGTEPTAESIDAPPLHGEHGFRFFPAFYRHVTNTMERIPDGESGGTVADNLVETSATLIANVDGPPQVAETSTPDTLRGWLEALRPAFAEDLPREDVRFLLERLLYLLTACDDRREDELDDVSWWEFIDAENRSQEFRDRLAYATQALVALRPQVGSARTIGTIYLQLLFGQLDPTQPTEQVLNAPTSVAWIDPWVRYLEGLGVDLRANAAVRALEFDGRRITGATLADGERVVADEFVLAVPVEVAPEFVTPELARAAPELGRIERLDTAWMNGIQFYLSEDVELTRGHQVYADSPWALTSISQRQFWRDHEYDVGERGPDEVAGVLSAIASDWDTPGIVYGKPARQCTREEIATEVWAQLKAHLNVTGTTLSDDLLVDWFLDPSIVEVDDPGDGDRVENRSPLLINTAGSLRNRPPADVGVLNLTLAADYVRTNSDLASMESANEAGRRAANAVLERHARPSYVPAEIWELREPAAFEPFKRQDRVRYRLGLPHPAEVTQSVRSLTRRLGGRA
ncbi:NAD-binding domain and a Fe-S cluster-containing protein [Halobiforma haloterrestris]|uniref:NAD-binding domain and a Fe-S cluster-containing protein n=1 Tax=Natronobacterium haloterrestre TaxID=148448 RepID=A0A1I1H4E6_NATHA|nr:FAD-dependent oxidoreductase [Halobiforma haloterrestris]SFC18605.1 NAD-binding domain and a Fe-S cluster-containing protein [Halobiforma haloterrestris]